MTYVPQEATNVTDFYLVGRTFPEQKFSSYYEANKALWEIPDSVVKYDGEVGIAGYDANGELVYTYYRESMPEDI